MFKEIIDFSYYLFSKKERKLLLAFLLSYLVFALNVIPVDIPLGIALLVFVIAPLKLEFVLFTFYTLFEYVSVFSFGVTLNLIIQLIFVAKAIRYISSTPNLFRYKGGGLKLFFVCYWLIYGICGMFFYKGFTGFSVGLRMLLVCLAIPCLQNADTRYNFWKMIFHIMYIATAVSVIYGIFNDTSLERYISGMQGSYASQLYGSLGTSRLGMFTAASIIYPLYYVTNRYAKLLLILTMVVSTFMTVSITAIGALGIVFAVYFLSMGKIRKVFVYSSMAMLILIATYGFWSKLSFVQPVIYRIEFSMVAAEAGDMNVATTGREDLKDYYLNSFYARNLIEKTIGTFNSDTLDPAVGTYAHNSYIDMLSYIGVLGILLIFLYSYKNVRLFINTESFYPVLTLKLIMVVVAYTVSIFTSLYWTWFLFL